MVCVCCVSRYNNGEQVKDGIMKEALIAKFTQHEDIQKVLLATGDALIVEHTENDRYRAAKTVSVCPACVFVWCCSACARVPDTGVTMGTARGRICLGRPSWR